MEGLFHDNFILRLPNATPENYFNEEVVVFLLLLLVLANGYLICFLGYKTVFVSGMIYLGAAVGYVSITNLNRYINDPVFLMLLFVLFVFLAELIFYGIYSTYARVLRNIGYGKKYNFFTGVWDFHLYMCDKYNTRTPVRDVFVFFSPFTGPFISSVLIYIFVFRNSLLCLILYLVTAALGYYFQKKRRKEKHIFYTYEDIYYRS